MVVFHDLRKIDNGRLYVTIKNPKLLLFVCTHQHTCFPVDKRAHIPGLVSVKVIPEEDVHPCFDTD